MSGKKANFSLSRFTKFLATFPKTRFRNFPQVKRAALSVPANIAKGFGRFHYLAKAKFYLNARGSLYELKSHLLVAKELGFIRDGAADDSFELLDQLSLKINNLINATRRLRKND